MLIAVVELYIVRFWSTKKKPHSHFILYEVKMSTITDAISQDHRTIAGCYKWIGRANDVNTATRWHNQLIRALAQHLVAKEMVVHPAIEKNLGMKGKVITEKSLSDHEKVSLLIF